jgi:predicted ATPase/DNA-binding winged helix-turn-helix (wHTH) protein
MSSERLRQIYASGECEIDVARRELRILGAPAPLGGRAFEIIEALVEAAGALVTKNELMDRIWPNVTVLDNTLQVHTAAIRKALGPYRGLLKTDAGRGYRLLGHWNVQHRDGESELFERPPIAIFDDSRASNFPAPTTRLVGRAAAMSRLRDLVSAYRIVTLSGTGGIGKTTLALKAARFALSEFADAGCFVEFASVSDQRLVAAAAAAALGLRLESTTITAEAVASAIGKKNLVLLLDNCEHVIDAAATLADTVVRLCPNVTILATSREAFQIPGECVYRVPPLQVPSMDQVTPQQIMTHSAPELFVTRARELGWDFGSQTQDLPVIAAICRHLDGIPLALEFAAARAVTLGIRQVDAGLRDRFALLTSGRRTALPRQRTLRATLDWSYDLLPASEQRMLGCLGIFAGRFKMQDAIAIVSDEPDVFGCIANLVEKSLLTADTGSTPTDYRLLESIRVYALEKLVDTGGLDTMSERHARYFLNVIETAEAEAETRATQEWLNACAARIDDIHAALDWCFGPAGNQTLGLALTVAAVPVWMHVSLVVECRTRAQRALAIESSAADLRMKLLGALAGTLLGGVADDLDVKQVWSTVFDVAEELGNTDYQLRALLGMCRDHYKESKLDEALILSEKFQSIAERSDNPVDRLIGHRMMGYTLHFRGDQSNARKQIETMLNGYDTVAHGSHVMRYWFDRRVTAQTRLAQILWLQGFPDQAAKIVDESLQDALAGGHGPSLCSMLAQGPCPIAIANGDLKKADAAVRLLLELSAKHELKGWSIWGHAFDSLIMIRRGAIAEGCYKLREQVERSAHADTPLPFTGFIPELALAHARLGERRLAIERIDATLDRCIRDHELWIYPELLRAKGEIIQAQDNDAAEQLFLQALDEANQQETLSWSLRAATSLANLRRTQGRTAEAREPLATIYARFTEGFETADLKAARILLA